MRLFLLIVKFFNAQTTLFVPTRMGLTTKTFRNKQIGKNFLAKINSRVAGSYGAVNLCSPSPYVLCTVLIDRVLRLHSQRFCHCESGKSLEQGKEGSLNRLTSFVFQYLKTKEHSFDSQGQDSALFRLVQLIISIQTVLRGNYLLLFSAFREFYKNTNSKIINLIF